MTEYIKKEDVLHLIHTFPIEMAMESIPNLKGIYIDENESISKPDIFIPSKITDTPHIPYGGEEYTMGYKRGWNDCITEVRSKNNVKGDIHL